MSKINKFFSLKNTIQNISDSENKQTYNYLDAVKSFARITNQSIYLIDYNKKGFDYVSDNPLFLCGNTAEEVKKMGYEFYIKHVPEEELDLLLTINTVGFDFYERIELKDRKEYGSISYDFHLINKEGKKILINQKLTPLFLNDEGKIWKAMCVVTLSTSEKAGNIEVHKNNDNIVFKYDLEKCCWISSEKVKLNDREKEILQYSARGYTINDIASAIFLSPDTIKFHRKKLFEKLDVSNISEAIASMVNNQLI